jgi:1-acyl-sn-glycerol-3-phosphate acyltransferase
MTSDRGRVPLRVANPQPVQPVYRWVARVGGWLLRRLVDRDWDAAACLPSSGGVIVVSNHISNFDPLCLGQYLIWNGRWPRAMIKADIFTMPVLGRLATATGQIPVERGTERAEEALARAGEALARGECVLIYPEGTITADPDTWPMTAYPGAARLALATGAPVIPVGQWGANFVMPGKKLVRPRFRPRRTVSFRAGPAVSLDDLAGRRADDDVQRASERIMAAITALVGELRGEAPPAEVYDLRVGRRVPRGGGS